MFSTLLYTTPQWPALRPCHNATLRQMPCKQYKSIKKIHDTQIDPPIFTINLNKHITNETFY